MPRRKQFHKDAYWTLSNCFGLKDDKKGKWAEVFGNTNPIVLELGCGKADFSYGMAKRYPNKNFIGIDLKADRLWYAASAALEENLHNIKFLRINLLSLQECFELGEVSEVWITFPDPFPKKRQAKHRMTNVNFLEQYRKILNPGANMFFKTDDLTLFQFSLEVLVKQPNVTLQDLTFDLHQEGEETLRQDAKILTAYERQFMEMGKKINYTAFSFVE